VNASSSSSGSYARKPSVSTVSDSWWRSATRSRIVDSSAAFAGITYRSSVPRSARINTGDLSFSYVPRPRVAFESGFHVHLVDLNGSFEVWKRRVQRPQEALDAPVDRLVRNVDLHAKLSETRVEADVGVNSEEPLSETNRRVLKDCPCLIVECTVAIFTPVSLEHSIAAVTNHRFGTAAWAIDAVMPANLCQQIRGSTLQNKRFDWEHRMSGDTSMSPLPAVTSSDW